MIRTAIGSPHTEPWLVPIGKLAVNFGALELQTYFWIDLLFNGTQVDRALDERFKVRVDRILKLLPQKIAEPELVSDVAEAWGEALEIAKFRNSLLHSALVFAYSTSDENRPPDFIGMPDVHQLRMNEPIRPIATLAEINSTVDRIVACATRLEQFLERAKALIVVEIT